MKKTVFALFAVLLVLSLATCDLLEAPQAAKSVTEDGQVMKTITIKVEGLGAPRALTLSNADPTGGSPGPGAADYYEVVFKMGSNYYETAWLASTGSGTITVPIANYGDTPTNDAVLFAGFNSNKTLLGVGTISAGANVTASSAANSVTFNVTALTNGISTSASGSTFKITGPTVDNHNGWNYATATTGNSPAIAPVGTTPTIPVFPVPGYDAIKGAYTATDITATYDVTIPHGSKLTLTGCSGTPVVLSPWPGGETAATGTVTYSATPSSGALLDGSNTFTLGINVSGVTTSVANNGLCAFNIAASVRAFSSASATYANTQALATPIIWVIRGGTDTATADDGSDNGAAVVLAVGTHANFEKTFTITNPTW